MEKRFDELYTERDRQVMKIAEDTLDPRIGRVEEIILFAQEAGIKKTGIANCISFEKEAVSPERLLTDKGFRVSRANCKLGRMPLMDILPGYDGISCNPAGQAQLMNEDHTELNLVMGLCLGHDMILNAKSNGLATTLIVKDRKFKHNPLEKFKTITYGNESNL